jgi:hypothetical protein
MVNRGVWGRGDQQGLVLGGIASVGSLFECTDAVVWSACPSTKRTFVIGTRNDNHELRMLLTSHVNAVRPWRSFKA